MEKRQEMEVDRIEEGFAVLVDADENIRNIPCDHFPFELHPGDSLLVELEGDRVVFAEYLAEKTEERRARIAALMAKLRKK